MKCKATNTCKNKAEYIFLDLPSCDSCLRTHIADELFDEAIQDYIDLNATKLESEHNRS